MLEVVVMKWGRGNVRGGSDRSGGGEMLEVVVMEVGEGKC